jgi:hypothetical protein
VQSLQVVYSHDAPTAVPASFQTDLAGIHATTTWQRVDDHTFRRVAELEITQPFVAAADYASVRAMLRNWTRHLDP